MRRVVVTGVGVISPVGNTIEEFWDNIKNGKNGIGFITKFDTSDIDVKLAGEVKDFNPEQYIDKKEVKRNDVFCQYAIASSMQALNDCGTDFSDIDPYKVGVIIGSGIGGINVIETEHKKFLEKGHKRMSALFVPMMISDMAAGAVSIKTGFKGANYSTVTACASGSHAIGEAFRKIKYGYLDACITGGTEAAITKFAIGGFNNMTALSRSQDPNRASIPFDKERNGFVMGEGSGILILEELEHAKNRGAKIYAEIVGYGATGDAYHITSPDPEGYGAAKAMEFAMEEASISEKDIDYINAHGTSTPLNDNFETKAIKIALKDKAKSVAISSTKSMTGHLLGAAGAIEAIITSLAIKDGVIPATINYKQPDPECDLDYVTEGTREQNICYALSNSLGFGGHNATLCFKKYQD